MAKENTKEDKVLEQIKSLKESVDILADSVTTLGVSVVVVVVPGSSVVVRFVLS